MAHFGREQREWWSDHVPRAWVVDMDNMEIIFAWLRHTVDKIAAQCCDSEVEMWIVNLLVPFDDGRRCCRVRNFDSECVGFRRHPRVVDGTLAASEGLDSGRWWWTRWAWRWTRRWCTRWGTWWR